MVYGVGSIGSKFIAFLLLPLYTHYLTPEEFGNTELVNITLLIAVPIISLQASEAVFRFLLDTQNNRTKDSRIITSTFIICILGFIGTIFITGIAIKFNANIGIFKEKFILILLLFFTTVLVSVFKQVARGLGKNSIFALSDILQTTIIGSSAVYFISFKRIGIDGYFYSFIIANLIVIIVVFILCRMWKYIIVDKLTFQYILPMLSYGLPFIPNVLAGWFINAVDRFFIAKYEGIIAVGIYSVAFKYASILTILNGIFILSWQTLAIKNTNSNPKDELFSKIFKVYIFLLSLMYLTMLSISKPFLKIIVASEYYYSWEYVPYLVGSSFFMGISSFFAVSYIVSKKTKELFYTSIGFGIINIILNALFVPKYGVIASAISTIVSTVGLLIIRRFSTRNQLYIKIPYKMFSIYIIIIISSCILQYQNLDSLLEGFLNIVLILIFLIINKSLIMESIKLIKELLIKKLQKR